jgi:hypothetical protein
MSPWLTRHRTTWRAMCLCVHYLAYINQYFTVCRYQWPRGLRLRSVAANLLEQRVRIPPGAWMSVSYECGVLLGRGFCERLNTRPEDSYWVWCVCAWSPVKRGYDPESGRSPKRKKIYNVIKHKNGLQTKHEEETVISTKKRKAFVKRISVYWSV